MGSFTDALKGFEAHVEGKVSRVVRGSIEELGDRLIERTPKDTGRAKSNWNLSLETPDPHTTERTDIRTLNNIEDIPREAGGFIYFVTNGLPYAPALERGHSQQAPNGMVGLTAMEWPQIVDLAVQRAGDQ